MNGAERAAALGRLHQQWPEYSVEQLERLLSYGGSLTRAESYLAATAREDDAAAVRTRMPIFVQLHVCRPTWQLQPPHMSSSVLPRLSQLIFQSVYSEQDTGSPIHGYIVGSSAPWDAGAADEEAAIQQQQLLQQRQQPPPHRSSACLVPASSVPAGQWRSELERMPSLSQGERNALKVGSGGCTNSLGSTPTAVPRVFSLQ